MDYSDTTGDDRLWATLSYILALFFPIVAPLIVFVVKRQSRFVAFHSLQALLIEVGIFLFGLVVTVISIVLAWFGPLALLALPLYAVAWGVGIAGWVFKIVAAFRSNAGDWYRVPIIGAYAERYA